MRIKIKARIKYMAIMGKENKYFSHFIFGLLMAKRFNSSELKQLFKFAYPERNLLIWGTIFLALGLLVLLAFSQTVRITMD
jgi:hypothetical protein